MQNVLKFVGVPAGVVAFCTLWIWFQFPVPALSGDIEKLSRKQAIDAVEIYNMKLRGFLASPPPKEDERARLIWEQEVAQARDQLKRAEDRKIKFD